MGSNEKTMKMEIARLYCKVLGLAEEELLGFLNAVKHLPGTDEEKEGHYRLSFLLDSMLHFV